MWLGKILDTTPLQMCNQFILNIGVVLTLLPRAAREALWVTMCEAMCEAMWADNSKQDLRSA